MKLHAHELETFCTAALIKVGVAAEDARLTADVLVTTDTWGIFTHGTKNLRGYIRRIRGGGIRKDAQPTLIREGPAWAVIDAGSALGPVASCFAMRAAIGKARSAGIAYVGLRNSCHFGAAGYYAAMAAREGLIGLAMANDTPTMTVPGARGAVLGNNPFSFAIPTGEAHPILLDIALSTVAGGKVFAAATRGESIPDHWLVDAEGRPTTDPRLFPQHGALTPMAAHKGYGLAVLVETLSAILTGASVASQVLSWTFADASLPTGHGAAFLAIDVNAIMPADTFHQRVQEAVQEIRSAPGARGAARIYLPGEMEWERREKALVEGIELPEDVVVNLRAMAEELSLDWNRAER
jgi:LDH2 family malate/lactate/ureidoglycolate dehydrogenase